MPWLQRLLPPGMRCSPEDDGFFGVLPIFPGMIAESIFAVGREEGEEFAARFGGEAGADADVLENFRVVVETEEKGTDLLAGGVFVPAESGNDAVAIALVLDFEHDALVGLIGEIDGFGDDAVEAGAFEALEPVECDAAICCGGRDVEWAAWRISEAIRVLRGALRKAGCAGRVRRCRGDRRRRRRREFVAASSLTRDAAGWMRS